MKYLGNFKKAMSTYIFIGLLIQLSANQCLYGQGFNLVDIMSLEIDNSEVYMNTNSVLADSGLVISGGVSLVESSTQPFTFQTLLSGYDLQGVKKFQKHLKLPTCYGNNVRGYSSIGKIAHNKYVVCGGGYDTTVRKQYNGVSKPFLFYFNKEGDSLGSFILQDTNIDRQCFGVAIDKNENVLAIGLQGSANGWFDATLPWGGAVVLDSTYFWLMKLDKTGQLLWHRSYLHLRSEQWGASPTKLLISPNQQEYMIAGTLNYGFPYLLKTDSAGNELWYKPLPMRERYEDHPNLISPNECSIDIALAPGGGYYFISSTPYWCVYNAAGDTASQYAFYYGKLDEQGDTLWTKQYQPYDPWNINYGRQIQVAANGDLIMSGNVFKRTDSVLNTYEDRACVFRADSLGNVKWYREPMHYTSVENGPNVQLYHQLYSLSLTPGHDGILAGGIYIGYYNPAKDSLLGEGANTYSWLILMDSLGQRCAEDTVLMDVSNPCGSILFPLAIGSTDISGLNCMLYPNPAYGKVHVKIEGNNSLFAAHSLQLHVYDIQGKPLMQQGISQSDTEIDISALSKGMYVFQLWQDGRKVQFWKVVKL